MDWNADDDMVMIDNLGSSTVNWDIWLVELSLSSPWLKSFSSITVFVIEDADQNDEEARDLPLKYSSSLVREVPMDDSEWYQDDYITLCMAEWVIAFTVSWAVTLLRNAALMAALIVLWAVLCSLFHQMIW
jgi:hypothetical protein